MTQRFQVAVGHVNVVKTPVQRLFIPGPMPGMNEIIDARMRSGGGAGKRWNAYSTMKKKWGCTVALVAHSTKLGPVGPGFFTYLLRESSKRRDPSNALFGAVKLIEDGLQEAGLLCNDGWGDVLGMTGYWIVDKDVPGCTLFVHPDRVLTKEEAVGLDDTHRSDRWQRPTTA